MYNNFQCYDAIEDSEDVSVKKKRCCQLTLALASVAPKDRWTSKFNLEDKVETSQKKVGDGASSEVYIGIFSDMTVAVKQLKCYSPRFASDLIKSYECLFHLKHGNVVKVLGICPKAGYIFMEYCETIVHGHTMRTLEDLLLHYGSDLPMELGIVALCDVSEGCNTYTDRA